MRRKNAAKRLVAHAIRRSRLVWPIIAIVLLLFVAVNGYLQSQRDRALIAVLGEIRDKQTLISASASRIHEELKTVTGIDKNTREASETLRRILERLPVSKPEDKTQLQSGAEHKSDEATLELARIIERNMPKSSQIDHAVSTLRAAIENNKPTLSTAKETGWSAILLRFAVFVSTIMFVAIVALAVAWLVLSDTRWSDLKTCFDKENRPRTITVSLVSLASLIGPVTLLSGDFTLFNFKTSLEVSGSFPTSGSTLSVELPSRGFAVECREDARIGGFLEAQHDQGDLLLAKIDATARELKQRNSGGRLVALFFVGSADKRSLKNASLKIYGSNAGLAHARAKWVRDELRTRYAGDLPQTMLLSNGPNFVGANIPPEALTKDRSVQICELWSPPR